MSFRFIRLFTVLGVGFVMLPVATFADEVPPPQRTVLFSERSDGFMLYRIPGIVVTAKGTVLVYCEARKYSAADRGEMEIHLRRSEDWGRDVFASSAGCTPGLATGP